MEVSTVHLVCILFLVLIISMFILNPIESINPANYKEGLSQNILDHYYNWLNSYGSPIVATLNANPSYIPMFNSTIASISTIITTSDFYKNFSMSKSNFLPVFTFLTQDTKNVLMQVITRFIAILTDINNSLKPNVKTW